MIQASLKEALVEKSVPGIADGRSNLESLQQVRALRWEFIGLNVNPNEKKRKACVTGLHNLLVQAEKRRVQTLIFSDENLLGHPPSFYLAKFGRALFYSHNELIAEVVREACRDWPSKIVFTIRQQDTLFPSHYLDGLRWLRLDMSLDAFWDALKSEGIHRLRFDNLLLPWRVAFGSENVNYCHFERLLKDANEFMDEIANAMQLPKGILLPPNSRVNSSFPGFKAAMALDLYQKIKLGEIERKTARHQLLNAEPKPGEKSIPQPKLSKNNIAEIRRLFADDLSFASGESL